MPDSPPPERDDLSFVRDDLRLTLMRLVRRIRAERADGGIGDGQLSVLFVLWKNGPHTLGALSERERVSAPSMNRTVNALAEAGLVTRNDAPDDGRKVLLDITPAGVAIVCETKRRRAEWFTRQLETLPPADIAALEAVAPILRTLADS